ncbi:MAG: flagella basal body P-ring formation protein FlgA [Burkholderiaceae bacterium]
MTIGSKSVSGAAQGHLAGRLPTDRHSFLMAPAFWGRTRIGVKCGRRRLDDPDAGDGQRLWRHWWPAGCGRQCPGQPGRLQRIGNELTRTTGQPILDPSGSTCQMTTRPMRAGDILMTYHLRVKLTVAAGDPVRVRVVGKGFVVSATGAALTAGTDGQALRVRTALARC